MFRRDPAQTLADQLTKLRLVTAQQIQQARDANSNGSVEKLIDTLEQQGALTSSQAASVRTGDAASLVLGNYKLMYRSAAGSFARVYRAESLDGGRMVALKLLRGRHASDAKEVAQFQREAKLVQRLRHENIVPIYDVGSVGDNHFYTMEFVEGGNLREFLNVRKKLSIEEATRYTLDVARALAYANAHGVTHRDMKLGNVLMTTTGVAKLIDFGLAGGAENRAIEYSVLERNTDAPADDPRSDLFFLGAIYYELLSGVAPWPSTRSRDERRSVSRYRDVRPVAQVDPSLPRRVSDVVDRLLEWSPYRRYATADEVILDLEAVLRSVSAGQSASAKTSSPLADSAEAAGASKSSAPAAGGDAPDGFTDMVIDCIEGPAAPASASPPPKSRSAPAGGTIAKPTRSEPAVLCVERRPSRQNLLRDYLGRRGFRPLFISDASRAIARLESNPPEAIVFMGDAVGDDLAETYEKVVAITQETAVVAVFVLTEAQLAERQHYVESPVCRILTQPLSLRELRRQLQLGMKHILTESRLTRLPPIPE